MVARLVPSDSRASLGRSGRGGRDSGAPAQPRLPDGPKLRGGRARLRPERARARVRLGLRRDQAGSRRGSDRDTRHRGDGQERRQRPPADPDQAPHLGGGSAAGLVARRPPDRVHPREHKRPSLAQQAAPSPPPTPPTDAGSSSDGSASANSQTSTGSAATPQDSRGSPEPGAGKALPTGDPPHAPSARPPSAIALVRAGYRALALARVVYFLNRQPRGLEPHRGCG